MVKRATKYGQKNHEVWSKRTTKYGQKDHEVWSKRTTKYGQKDHEVWPKGPRSMVQKDHEVWSEGPRSVVKRTTKYGPKGSAIGDQKFRSAFSQKLNLTTLWYLTELYGYYHDECTYTFTTTNSRQMFI